MGGERNCSNERDYGNWAWWLTLHLPQKATYRRSHDSELFLLLLVLMTYFLSVLPDLKHTKNKKTATFAYFVPSLFWTLIVLQFYDLI